MVHLKIQQSNNTIDKEGGSHGLISGTILEFAQRDWEQTWKSSVKIAHFWVWKQKLKNKIQEY